MTRRRTFRAKGAAAALAALLALAGCDQAASLWARMSGQKPAQALVGPTPLDQAPLEARALSGSVQPQDAMTALLAPAPVTVAAGEILAGLRDADASDPARLASVTQAATLMLEQVGVQGSIEQGAGFLKITLVRAPAPAGAPPQAIEWNDADRCPVVVLQDQLEKEPALATRCVIQRLQTSRRFAYVEPNYIATLAMSLLPKREPPASPAAAAANVGAPNDPLYALQWSLRERGAGVGRSPGGAGFVAFWRTHHVGSRLVRVAVIDTGLDFTHPEFAHNTNVTRGVDVISDRARAGDGDGVDADAQDVGDACEAGAENSFHGAHVAGIIGAASGNAIGVAGGDRNVTLLPVRAIGRCGGELADLAQGILWAVGAAPVTTAHGAIANATPADIINLSWTIQAPCPGALQAAIDTAAQHGALIVVAAGNKANQARLYAPANCNNVIVVGAGDAQGNLAFYSNFGLEINLIATGGDMFADTDGDGRPDGVLSTRATTLGCFDPLTQGTAPRCFYSFQQGTSLAAAHVSAALALLAAESGSRGNRLRDELFAHAVTPFPAGFGQIECAKVRNANEVGDAGLCARPSGRGYLDLTRAAQRLSAAP